MQNLTEQKFNYALFLGTSRGYVGIKRSTIDLVMSTNWSLLLKIAYKKDTATSYPIQINKKHLKGDVTKKFALGTKFICCINIIKQAEAELG